MNARKAVLATAVILLLAFYGGLVAVEIRTWFWTLVDVPDVSQPATLRLTHSGWQRPSGIVVQVTGHIDGEAEVWASNWERKKLSGEVNWEVYHDWFAFDLDLHYQPIQVRSGHLTVRYRFPH